MHRIFRVEDSRSLWDIRGSFGEMPAEVKISGNTYSAENDKIRIFSEITDCGHGVFSKKGSVTNISNEKITINTLSSKFVLNGGEYEGYTQYNGWQSESRGAWQPLATSIEAHCDSVRNTSGAAPFCALWNNQTGRGVVFHLIAYCAWQLRLTRSARGGVSVTEAELGVLPHGFSYELMPGESVELPEILFYEAKRKIDLDCHKLHAMLAEKHPRREMPVIYNSWLYKFDRFSFEDLARQAEIATKIGVEYFMVDAGWFGDGSEWWSCRGDWEENMSYGFCGRMREFADLLRSLGLKLGFWLEPECASAESNIIREHPKYFLPGDGSMFLDFSNPDAVDCIFHKTCELIDRYGAKFIKFDFNADKRFDENRQAFMPYFNGHREYIKRLKAKYPDLYIENCASGGMRMSLRDGLLYDSFWLSDNQSPYYGTEIFKNTLLRMPPQWIECWATFRTAENLVPNYPEGGYADKLIATNDATWSDVTGVYHEYLKAFLTGSPIGISCDLAQFSDKTLDFFAKFIAQFKKDRDFWKNAVCNILTDTETMLVLQFSNSDFSRAELVVFKNHALQDAVRIYPILSSKKNYVADEIGTSDEKHLCEDGVFANSDSCKNAAFSGEELSEYGIQLPLDDYFTAKFISIKSV